MFNLWHLCLVAEIPLRLKFNCDAPLKEKKAKEKTYGALGLLNILFKWKHVLNFLLFLLFLNTSNVFLTTLCKFKTISPTFLLNSNNLYQVEDARCFTKLIELSTHCCCRNKIASVRFLYVAEFKRLVWNQLGRNE